jgi:DNA-binding protein H-NS
MAKVSLASMSVDALLKLRDEIGTVLSRRVEELREQLLRVGDGIVFTTRARGRSLKGRKAAIKYRDKSGNTWAGRGAQPVWLREKLKAGAKLGDFASIKKSLRARDHPRNASRPKANAEVRSRRRRRSRTSLWHLQRIGK